MATIHTKVAAIKNGIARKYRAGINQDQSERQKQYAKLKRQIVCSQR